VSVRILFLDFLGDYFTFDSKLFRSIFLLILKPGFLTKEYNEGKRMRYIRPLRMYLVASIAYFFLLSTTAPLSDTVTAKDEASVSIGRISEAITDSIHAAMSDSAMARDGIIAFDPATIASLVEEIPESLAIEPPGDSLQDSTGGKEPGFLLLNMDQTEIDSAMEHMRATQDDTANTYLDSMIKEFLLSKYDRLKGMSIAEFTRRLLSDLEKNLPKMMFFLLPVFALLLKMIYPLSKRFYVEHLIFSFHFHAFMFIVLTLLLVFDIEILQGVAPFVVLLYLFLAMKTAYVQSYARTLLKMVMLMMSYCVVLGLAFMITVLATMVFL
jgi:hypothetical protein